MQIKPNDSPESRIPIKVNDIYAHVKRYRLHEALSQINIVCAKIFSKDSSIEKYLPATINEFQLAFLAKALILNSNDHRYLSFGDKGLFKCADLFNNLTDPFLDIPNNSPKEQLREGMDLLLIRMSNQQFPFQISFANSISRFIILFEIIPSELINPKINIHKEILALYGLTPKELIIIGFAVFATAGKGYFDPNYLINTESKDLKKYLSKPAVSKFISSLTADYNKLRELFRNEENIEGLEQYSFNALRTFPIVKTQTAGLVVPIPRFVLESISNGIFYSLSNKFREINSNPFLEFFGKDIFENYVGKLLKMQFSKNKLIREFEYGSRHKKSKSPDWIIIEEDKAVLIECKTSGLTKDAKTLGDKDKLINDLRKRAVQGIIQSDNFVKNFKEGNVNIPELKKVKKFYYIVVTYDRIFLTNTPSVRGYILKELEDNGVNNVNNFLIIGIDELEILMPILNELKFTDLIDAKSNNKLWDTYDFDSFISDYIKNMEIDIDRENYFLNETLDNLMKEVSPNLKLTRK